MKLNDTERAYLQASNHNKNRIMKMKLKYFKWSPIGTIVLICNIGFLVAFIVSEGTFCKAAGFLGITMLFIARGIMWSGWWMEKNQALQDEIDFLESELGRH